MNRITLQLEKKQVSLLKKIVKTGVAKARTVIHANVLLLANKEIQSKDIAQVLSISRITVANVKKRYKNGGLNYALYDKPRSGQPKKYHKNDEAKIIATACSKAPDGRKRWTIRLLTNEVKKRHGLKTINRESVRLILKKAKLDLG